MSLFFFFFLTKKERHTNQDEEINRMTVNLTMKGAKVPRGPFLAQESLKHCHKEPYTESFDSWMMEQSKCDGSASGTAGA